MEKLIKDSSNESKLYGQTPPYNLLRPLVYSCYEAPRVMLDHFLDMTKEAKGIVTAYNRGNALMQDDKQVFINYQNAMLNKALKKYDVAQEYFEKAYDKACKQKNRKLITLERMKLRTLMRNRSE